MILARYRLATFLMSLVANRHHGSSIEQSTIATLRNPKPSAVAVSDLRRNLEALFSPRLKVSARKFGELTPLKLLAVSERRCLVS